MSASKSEKPYVLITGASGGLARLVARDLSRKYRVVGVDPRDPPAGSEFPGDFYRMDYTKRKVPDIFRQHPFHALIHLGRLRLDASIERSKRYHVNVIGTRHLLDLALKHDVKRVIVMSSFHVYGAHPDNPLSLNEDDPLRATQTFPELVDATELDHVATGFMLRHPEVRTTVLRPVNVIGSEVRNRISLLLRAKYCPGLLGYDPPVQFLHENDLCRAIRFCLEGPKSGVYNIAGEGVVSYRKAIELAGARLIKVPTILSYPAAGLVNRLGFSLPRHLIDFFRYPTIVTDAAFRRDFGYAPRITTVEALHSLRDGREIELHADHPSSSESAIIRSSKSEDRHGRIESSPAVLAPGSGTS